MQYQKEMILSEVREKKMSDIICSIGIDPGKTGALCALYHKDSIIQDFQFFLWPKSDNVRDVVFLFHELQKIKHHRMSICMEKVHSIKGNGASSMFSFGKNVGLWEGIMTALDLCFYQVTPQEWMKDHGLAQKKGKTKNKETGETETVKRDTKLLNCRKAFELSNFYILSNMTKEQKSHRESLLESIQNHFMTKRGAIQTGYVDAFLIALYDYKKYIS